MTTNMPSSGRVDVLVVIGKPLRKITRVIRYADSIDGSQRVELDCGHEASASSRAFGKARCGMCQKELRAAVAELIEAASLLLADSDRWFSEGVIASGKGTRTDIARELTRTALANIGAAP